MKKKVNKLNTDDFLKISISIGIIFGIIALCYQFIYIPQTKTDNAARTKQGFEQKKFGLKETVELENGHKLTVNEVEIEDYSKMTQCTLSEANKTISKPNRSVTLKINYSGGSADTVPNPQLTNGNDIIYGNTNSCSDTPGYSYDTIQFSINVGNEKDYFLSTGDRLIRLSPYKYTKY